MPTWLSVSVSSWTMSTWTVSILIHGIPLSRSIQLSLCEVSGISHVKCFGSLVPGVFADARTLRRAGSQELVELVGTGGVSPPVTTLPVCPVGVGHDAEILNYHELMGLTSWVSKGCTWWQGAKT
ncbi:hypothetical protein B0T24DRAFT_597991 [Lasiosphaeria ovina]|uniref:Uncharacterized protein n=1 Tax=Lasiosphaeria ovina TaxID=92902 RepID=A0AAE0JYB6_9PEZI|nr:hypothetical protein B0T24DRAFT_597991 [Lasiosphaeria ovina]